MFTEEQEEWLGEILDRQFKKEFHVLEDPEGRLQQLGERLLAQLPPTRIHYRFAIVDSPQLNSFGIAGGRVFIFRRAIAFAQSEDELAALLGHEIGHIITHQSAIEITRWFHDLGISQVSDRQDLLNKWNQVMDNAAKIRTRRGEEREQEGQLIADRVGLYAMARAGYDPAQGVDYFDRLFLTKGKTGGFWSEFFGTARPENKRLRELIHNSAPLPSNCVTPPPAATRNTFLQWRDAIIGTNRVAAKEDVAGLTKKTALRPSLRDDLDQLQYSPNGKYLLAQDASSIYVLSGDPLANLFRIDAPEAYPARFTPDSSSIVFYDRELRVQKWTLETKQRASIHELNVKRCWGSGLSPTGEVLACARPRLEIQSPVFELQLIDVATGKPLLIKDKFYELSFWELLALRFRLLFDENPSMFMVRFSPDGRYVVVSRRTTSLAYDFKDAQEIKMPPSFKQTISSSFAFVLPGEIAAFDASKRKMARIQFPSGHVDEEFSFATGGVTLPSVQNGKLVIVHGSKDSPVGVLDMQQKKIIMAYKVPAFALNEPFFAGEGTAGQVVIGKIPESQVLSQINLSESPLGAVRVATFSQDGKWLAVSGSSRGAVWSLENGDRVFHVTNFDGAFFDANDQLFMKFPAKGKQDERVFQFDPDSKGVKKPYDLSTNPGSQIEEEDESSLSKEHRARSHITQLGNLLLKLTPKSEKWNRHDYDLEVRDVRTNDLLWERKFEGERPRYFYSVADKTLTLVLAKYDNIRDAVKDNPPLLAKLEAIDAKKDSYLIQPLDGMTGKPLGAVLVDTGKLSFAVERAVTRRDTVAVEDSINRVLVYSLNSGEQRGKVFGRCKAVSPDGGRLLVENEAGISDLYESSGLRSLRRFVLPARIVHAEFMPDGNGILLLTADQAVYTVRSSDQAENAGLPK